MPCNPNPPVIPRIDISALFSSASPGRALADDAIMAAASGSGFMTVCGLPPRVPIEAAARRALLRLFDLPPSVTRRLWRQKFDPAHRNVYRGWFPLQNGAETYKEGIDLGPESRTARPASTTAIRCAKRRRCRRSRPCPAGGT